MQLQSSILNENLSQEKRTKNGVEQYNVVYPKFLNGEAVVRKVSVKQNFGKLQFAIPLTTIIEHGNYFLLLIGNRLCR